MKNGEYILIKAPEDYPGKKYRGIYAYEHHIVFWKHTGHIIKNDEVLHHQDGNKTHNNFNNLKLTKKSIHAYHHTSNRGHIIVKLKCPYCKKIFYRRKQQTHLSKKQASTTSCSRTCAGKWGWLQKNVSKKEFQKIINENVISYFHNNGA